MNAPAVVAVVGGGASGCLSAAHLVREAALADRRIELLLIEPGAIGKGIAYSTPDPRHRLNVPAARMSAWPDDPEHFLRWVKRHVDTELTGDAFVPRMHYARYLAQTLADEVRGTPSITFTHLSTRVTDVRRHGRRLRMSFADGTSRQADAVALALGYGAPRADWLPSALQRSPYYVADPWADPYAEPPVAPGQSVVLVGAGLTMADTALRWGREGVTLHVVSRHGLLPLAHRAHQAPVPMPDLGEGPLRLSELRRLVFTHLRAVAATGGDWRAAIDGLRPQTAALWRRLPAEERAKFVELAARRWDRVRHRVEPGIGSWLDQRQADGSLVTHAASVENVVEAGSGAGLEVQLSTGERISATAVVNCTGPCGDIRRSDDPLLMNLLDSGLASPGPLDLGFATDENGRLRPQRDEVPSIWAVGPLRKGELWESTAIPEIRVQASEVARALLDSLPDVTPRRRPRDTYGLPFTATAAASRHYLDAHGRILRVESGAAARLRASVKADPQFALGHATLALLGAEWDDSAVDVTAHLAAAKLYAGSADERERRFIEVVTARIEEPGAGSAPALLSYIQTYPEDAIAVSIAVPTIAFGGATEIPTEAWALVEGLAPAYGNDWWYRGMLAFIRQEQERYGEADELAQLSLAEQPASGHAVHARTHVFYETGQHLGGLNWLDSWINTCGRRSSHLAHFSWHAALHELALGDDRAAAQRYRRQLSPSHVGGVRALVDSVALLWRAHALGAWDSTEVDELLSSVPRELLENPPTPFVALHAAIAMAAAHDCQGLAALRRCAAARPEAVFTNTVAPLADALVDLIHGDANRATDHLIDLTGVDHLGGSAAQREVVEETLLFAATQAGRHQLAGALLQNRLDRRESPRDRRRLADALRAEEKPSAAFE